MLSRTGTFLSKHTYSVWALVFGLNLLVFRLIYGKTWGARWLDDILSAGFITTAELLLIPRILSIRKP